MPHLEMVQQHFQLCRAEVCVFLQVLQHLAAPCCFLGCTHTADGNMHSRSEQGYEDQHAYDAAWSPYLLWKWFLRCRSKPKLRFVTCCARPVESKVLVATCSSSSAVCLVPATVLKVPLVRCICF